MNELKGDLWSHRGFCDWTVITTNGSVKSDGRAVMGRGTALQAATKYPALPKALGECIRLNGNGLHVFMDPYRIIALPVKHEWWQKADLELIEKGLEDMAEMAKRWVYPTRFYLPRPGCGNGMLRWEDVKPMVQRILSSDRFTVVEMKP